MFNVLFNTFDGARKYINTIFIKDNKMEDNARLVFQIIFWTALFNHKHIKEIYYLIKGLTSVQNDR
tara:strand:+ start:376 stop:573 length:198 start_codon:yes stop_codon:yes gene_type:complete